MRSQPHGSFSLFGEASFRESTELQLLRLKEKIRSEEADFLVNVNAVDYLGNVVAEFLVDPPNIDFDHARISSREETFRVERYNIYTNASSGDSCSRQVITYHLPFTGDPELLRDEPNPSTNKRAAYLQEGEICIDVIDQLGNAQLVKEEAANVLGSIRNNLGYLSQNIRSFNQMLPARAKEFFEQRRAELRQRLSVIAELGLPIKKESAVPVTLAVPITRKKTPSGRTPDSAQSNRRQRILHDSTYQEILQTIHDAGRVYERLPSTYEGKDEEALRNDLILALEPHFEWASTTGETFNKAGKTDILIRYEKDIVFVAECKFWSGRKQHFETIDQILSYLTFRDSKTAIIYFVNSNEIAAPLKAIQDFTKEHTNFVAFRGAQDDTRFNFEFYLPGDSERIIQTAILCFHLPQPSIDESTNSDAIAEPEPRVKPPTRRIRGTRRR